MKVVCAYLLAVLGGDSSSSAAGDLCSAAAWAVLQSLITMVAAAVLVWCFMEFSGIFATKRELKEADFERRLEKVERDMEKVVADLKK